MTAHHPAKGLHLIADLAGGAPAPLSDPALIERVLRAAADAAKVRIVGLNLHHFGVEQGVTGVALLAESHISIHSWPEEGVAAIDIFVCGEGADAWAALRAIEEGLAMRSTHAQAIPRLGART
ncbi:adenosylmethionine decarboxylase [Novosphingobium terrae]|uniref:adenosylmethionine decarboxylase n=1 Tax=Novosphingobium terrae TaxID=2726189 RepID=UPI0019818DF6|nr:adenosylmethionine decarboxylase [Novosphingobium terrae]